MKKIAVSAEQCSSFMRGREEVKRPLWIVLREDRCQSMRKMADWDDFLRSRTRLDGYGLSGIWQKNDELTVQFETNGYIEIADEVAPSVVGLSRQDKKGKNIPTVTHVDYKDASIFLEALMEEARHKDLSSRKKGTDTAPSRPEEAPVSA